MEHHRRYCSANVENNHCYRLPSLSAHVQRRKDSVAVTGVDGINIFSSQHLGLPSLLCPSGINDFPITDINHIKIRLGFSSKREPYDELNRGRDRLCSKLL